jgi:hypothetical protein
MDINSNTLPDPYSPNPSDYYLMLSYNDPFVTLPVDITSTIVGKNILKFSMHLGVLENDHGIGYGIEFGLFAQAYRTVTDSDEFDYFAYDSIGQGSAAAPAGVISNLLTHTECMFDELDATDDDYGFNLKFKTPDRTSGAKLVSTSRTTHPELDINRLTCERVGFYFEVTISLAAKVSNETSVRYTVYLVEPNHTETGVHLTPNQFTDEDYPVPYAPGSGWYLHLGEYNNGTTIMADKTVVTANKLVLGFHLVRLQHPQLVNISKGTQFGVFATAVKESNTGSALEYSFYYDTAGFGSADGPTMILEPIEEKKESKEDKGVLYILGHIGGIPILLLIIIAIIIICIIAGYAAHVKSKYGASEDIDIPPVPSVPSPRSGREPNYGVGSGRVRDNRYYDSLFKDDYDLAYGDSMAGFGAGPGAMASNRDRYGYDVLPDDDEPEPMEQREDLAEQPYDEGEEAGLEMPEIMLPSDSDVEEEVEPTEDLTDEEMDLLVSPDELISDEVEAELKEMEETPDDDIEPDEEEEPEMADDEIDDQGIVESEESDKEDLDIIELPADTEEEELYEGEESDTNLEPDSETDSADEQDTMELDEDSAELDEEEPVDDVEPFDEEEPIDEDEPIEDEEEPVEEEDFEPIDEDEKSVDEDQEDKQYSESESDHEDEEDFEEEFEADETDEDNDIDDDESESENDEEFEEEFEPDDD